MKTLILSLILVSSVLAGPPESAKIDELLAKGWAQAGVKANAPASDETFLRRIYLDVLGRIPTSTEAVAFFNASNPNKRSLLIDHLLKSEGQVSHSFNYWADVLRLQTQTKGNNATGGAYASWLKQSLRKNQPYDAMVRELIQSQGGVWDNGAVGFYLRDAGMPLDHLATTVQAFLGTSIVCAQCHDHPFDKWTQKQYYELAAFTYGVDTKSNGYKMFGNKDKEETRELAKKYGTKRGELRQVSQALQDVMRPLRYTTITEKDTSLRLPHDYAYTNAKPRDEVKPVVLFGHSPSPVSQEAKTATFARWMTAPENPRFTKVIANRLWKRVMGLALIEPLDELTEQSVPSHPELMTYLEQLVKDKRYDMRAVLSVLYQTQAYQRSSTTKEVLPGEIYHFTGPLLRRMSAEQTWDSMVTLLTDAPDANLAIEDQALSQRLDALESLYTALDQLTPEDAFKHLEEIQASRKGTDSDNAQLREQLAVAKKAKDKAAIQRINQTLLKSRNQLARETGRIFFGEDMAETLADNLKKGKPKTKTVQRFEGIPREEIKKIRDSGLDKQAQKAKLQQLRDQLVATRRVMDRMSDLKRASELPSPAPRGHLLRLFGQSDREIIENASDEASVPQALALLNGDITSALASPASAFYQRLSQLPSTDPLSGIYLSLLSRKPSSDELSMLQQITAERGDKAHADVIYALLNSAMFLFIE
jgi:hypothetical protein